MKSQAIKFKKSMQIFDTEKNPIYLPPHRDLRTIKSLKVCKKTNSLALSETTQDVNSVKSFKRNSTLTADCRKIEEAKALNLEKLLNDRLEEFKNCKGNWTSEIEVLDSIYLEITNYFHKFARILSILRQKYEENFTKLSHSFYTEELEKTTKKNEVLLKKINSLSKINQDLTTDKLKLKKKVDDYERLFETNPNILINYQNIVEQMLNQCKVIENLKKENKSLKKSQVTSTGLISELKLQLRSKFSGSSFEIEA